MSAVRIRQRAQTLIGIYAQSTAKTVQVFICGGSSVVEHVKNDFLPESLTAKPIYPYKVGVVGSNPAPHTTNGAGSSVG